MRGEHGDGGGVGGDGGAQGAADADGEPGGELVGGGGAEGCGPPAQEDAAGEQGGLDGAEADEGEATADGGAEAFVAEVGVELALEFAGGAARGQLMVVAAYELVRALGFGAVETGADSVELEIAGARGRSISGAGCALLPHVRR
ncbi:MULTISPECIES: hypothetical protein [unclassified Streptomyces]|uniref:hypothetical protein n=1 Tax=unclassified Streptomyces TaxID=2593676 RepID=UPI0033208A0E